MKGDFSRQTFDAKKHYAGVLMQQGQRAIRTADWNEQHAIQDHRNRTEARDVQSANVAAHSMTLVLKSA